jgi:hypothetical protein
MIAARLTFLPCPTREQRLPARRELRLASFNRDRSALLVYGEHGQRRALRLTLPRHCDLRYYGDGPMPKDSTPVALGRTALHRPPCRQTQAQAEVLRDPDPHAWTRVSGPIPQPWERVAFEAMCLDHADDDELARRLAEYQRGRRPEYDERRRQVEAEIEALSLPKNEADHKRKELEARFTTVRRGWRLGEKEFVLVFDVTLEDVKDGTLGLRNEYLAEKWARIRGFDLDAIQREARAFHRWLGEVAYNAREHVINTGERRLRLELTPDQWKVLEASVRYELRFANSARVWLDGVEETATLTPQEAEDFEKLEGKPTADLAALQQSVKQTHKLVEEAHAKARAKARKWHQAGGKATSKWKGHETEAAMLARVMKQARGNCIRDKKTKRGATKWAIERGKAWWKQKFKGAALENFLVDLSDSNLYRVMRRDWRKRRKAKT